ncbi:NEAT domain-containing protein, partial [Microvirga sp. 3-52]|nr:NEAT domain-containing protein [Microvirga sp. 3-52]
NEEENTRDVRFTVEDLNRILAGKVSVDTGNPNFGVMHHDVRLQFDPSAIPVAEDEPEEEPEEEPKEENPGQSFKYADGEYDLPLTVLHATKDEESSMGKYVQNPSVVIKDGKATVSVTLTSSEMIAAFQVENNGEFIDTEVVSENKDENTRIVRFKVEDLDAIMAAKV